MTHEVRLAEQKARAEEAARKAEADAIRAQQEREARMADQAARAEAASKQLEADNRRAEEAHKQAMIEKARQADEAAKAAAEAKKRFEEEEVLNRKRREAEAEQQGIERKRREAERERQPPVRTPDNNEVKTDAGVSLAGTLANFMQYCLRDFQALTPQYQYAVLTYVQWEVRDHGADAVKQATIARYQDGYYTLGHRWCSIAASTAKSIASAMTR